MTVKRTRTGRSTSSGEIEVMAPPRAARVPGVGNSSKAMRGFTEENEVKFGIFRVASPVKREEECVESNVGFLERCYACKKELGTGVDVFMYSYLRAFCTIECRNRQIDIDNKAAALLQKGKGRST